MSAPILHHNPPSLFSENLHVVQPRRDRMTTSGHLNYLHLADYHKQTQRH
jgi:hypothetical protein